MSLGLSLVKSHFLGEDLAFNRSKSTNILLQTESFGVFL